MPQINDRDTLEQILDRMGLSNLIETLEGICRDKRDHILCNWQDEDLAKTWDEGANALAYALRTNVPSDL